MFLDRGHLVFERNPETADDRLTPGDFHAKDTTVVSFVAFIAFTRDREQLFNARILGIDGAAKDALRTTEVTGLFGHVRLEPHKGNELRYSLFFNLRPPGATELRHRPACWLRRRALG